MGNKIAKIRPKPLQLSKSKQLPVSDHKSDDSDGVFRTPKSSTSDGEIFRIGEVILHSDDSPVFVCDICAEQRYLIDSFGFKGCSHFYCVDCVVSYVSSKLDDSVALISCPESECGGFLEPEFCKSVLPGDLFDRWGIALCESVIKSSQRFYCPFRDCSVLLIDDGGGEIGGSLCPFCKREFCAKCKVPWHSEISCEKFQKLKKKGDDGMLIDLAKRKNWRRCPKCRFYVEKSTGCFYMRCRCGHAFCYKCGTRSSTTSHVCPNPMCKA